MNLRIYLILILFIIAGINLTAQNPYIQHYTTVDGLPSNMVYQVYQDSKKFLWFATDAGVAKYDGSKFTYYRKHDGLSSSEVIRIKEDSFGRIWFFNLNATLNYYYQNIIYNGTNAPFLDSLKSKAFFRNFFEDEDKTLYFYYNANQDVFALDSQNNVRKYKLPSVRKKLKFPSEFIKNNNFPEYSMQEIMILKYIQKTASGEFFLWMGSGIYKLENFDEEPILVSEEFGFKEVFPVSKKRGYIHGGSPYSTEFEILKYQNEIRLDTITPPIILGTIFISSIVEDVNGFIWISTFDKGVFCYKDNKIIKHFDIKQGQAIIQDHENNIWISSMKDGVYKVSPYINQHVQYKNSNFQNNAILGLCHHISNGIWCTDGRKVYLLQNDKLFTSDFQSETGSFNQLLQVTDSNLLVGEFGVFQYALEGIRLDPSVKKVYFNNVDVSPYPYKKFIINITGNQISTFDYQSLVFINPVKLFRDIKMVNLYERIYNIFYNTNNELVVNTKRNYLYKNDSLIVCEDLSHFDNKIITDHHRLNNDTELLNIEGDSLFLLKNKQLFNLTEAFGYPIDLQIKHMDYYKKTLFFSTSRNVYVCENPLDILYNKPVYLQPIDIRFRNIHDIIFNDDRLYIASDDGLTAIPYSEIQAIKTNLTLPYIQSIQINDNEDVIDNQEISLTGPNRISIVFSSINYSSIPVIYSYKLEGSGDEWVTATGTNVAFHNLSRGDYIFKLRVRKPTSAWSESIELPITIHATIWQHPHFLITLSILFAMLVTLVIIRRKNNQMKRQDLDHQLVTLEQKALQSMMNPHFIFNALSSIQSYLLQNKSKEAGLYLSQFARLIRQNLSAINSPMVVLEEEIDRLKNYLELEQLRMSDRFNYNIKIDENVPEDEVMIPTMILQPFVENAILHGISSLDSMGEIQIVISMDSRAALTIVIEDNGIGMKSSGAYLQGREKQLHLGMGITRKRLKVIGRKFHVETSIEITEASPDKPNPGTRVRIVVPIAYSGSKFK